MRRTLHKINVVKDNTINTEMLSENKRPGFQIKCIKEGNETIEHVMHLKKMTQRCDVSCCNPTGKTSTCCCVSKRTRQLINVEYTFGGEGDAFNEMEHSVI